MWRWAVGSQMITSTWTCSDHNKLSSSLQSVKCSLNPVREKSIQIMMSLLATNCLQICAVFPIAATKHEKKPGVQVSGGAWLDCAGGQVVVQVMGGRGEALQIYCSWSVKPVRPDSCADSQWLFGLHRPGVTGCSTATRLQTLQLQQDSRRPDIFHAE